MRQQLNQTLMMGVITIFAGMSESVTAQEAAVPISHISEFTPSEVSVTYQDDQTVITEGPEGTIRIDRDDELGTLTITKSDGSTETLTMDEAFSMVNSLSSNAQTRSRAKRDIERDWKKYMCNAATAAVIGGHQTAWSIALSLISVHPAIKLAVLGGHFAAGVFLSTQC